MAVSELLLYSEDSDINLRLKIKKKCQNFKHVILTSQKSHDSSFISETETHLSVFEDRSLLKDILSPLTLLK